MSLLPTIPMATGSGKPRLVIGEAISYTSAGTTTFSSTTATDSSLPSPSGIRVNQRISSFVVIAGQPNKPTFAKVLSVAGTTVTVDAWTAGTPTAAQAWTIDGWVIDLPYCYEMTERFEPDNLVHALYGGSNGDRLDTEFRGWKYQCTLDYSKYMSGDTLLSLASAFRRDTLKSMILIPHADTPQYQYNVYHAAAIEVGRYGKNLGHRKPVFTFAGKENVASWPILDGYGSAYATDYGNHL
jgi:hypothetical protein